jgi:integrase/recombinase XerD
MERFSALRTPRVNLTKYVQVAPDKWRFCAVVTTSSGRPRQDFVVVDGKNERHPEGYYSLDFYEQGKRKRESVGRDASAAHAEQQRKLQLFRTIAHGIKVVSKAKSLTVGEACSEFLEEAKQQRRPKTYNQYEVALRYFQESLPSGSPMNDVARKDLLRFSDYLRTEKELSGRTTWTKFAVVAQMLKQFGVAGLLKKTDWPRYVQAVPDTYRDDEMKSFFQNCDLRHRAIFRTFYMAGLRDQELQCLYVKDVDLGEQVIRVVPKPELGFIPKDWEQREIPIPDLLVSELREYLKHAPRCGRLMFPTSEGGRDYHLLDSCKRIAFGAGLNCGKCVGGKKSCAEGPSCRNWFLHKFRATFATKHLRSGVDLASVQSWLGHKNLASTMRYLQPARGKDVLRKVNSTFA